jgi:hypothetical protein
MKVSYAEMSQAGAKVQAAVNRGDLVRKPCEVCGAEKTHAHHDDYSKPLDVMWLCPKHHRERHEVIGKLVGNGTDASLRVLIEKNKLWKLKYHAAAESTTLQELVLRIIDRYLEQGKGVK